MPQYTIATDHTDNTPITFNEGKTVRIIRGKSPITIDVSATNLFDAQELAGEICTLLNDYNLNN